jgi:hypothetical protein
MIKPLSIVSAKAKTFFDTFNRANGSLERSSDGSLWQIIRGSWSVSSNKATSTDSSSTYPLAAIPTASANVDISLSGVSQGSSAALWVTDSGNWFAVGIDQTTVSCNCQTCTTNYNTSFTYISSYTCGNAYCVGNCANYSCTAWNYTCNVVGNRYCKTYNTNYCNKYFTSEGKSTCTGTWNTKNCTAYNAGNCNESYADQHNCKTYKCAANNYYACGACSATAWNANNPTYYSCNCQTCYPQYIRVIRSIASTVSTLTSFTVSSIVNSFKVLVRGSQITTKAYSGTDLTTQIDADLVYTPTGVAVVPKYGIMVKPSSYSQGNTIDSIQIENK